MKKLMRVFFITVICFAGVISAVWFGMQKLYEGRFGFGTWVSGVYATGLTPAEVSAALDHNLYDDDGLPAVVMLIGRGERKLAISTADLKMSVSYDDSVRRAYSEQTPLSLVKGIMSGNYINVTPVTEFDMKALEEAVDGWDIFDTPSDGMHIERHAEGYRLVADTRDMPNREAIISTAADKISAGEFYVPLDTEGSGCYTTYELTDSDRSVMDTWKAIEEARVPEISYCMGDEEIVLDASVTDDWIMTSDDLKKVLAGAGGAGNRAASGGRALAAPGDEEEEGSADDAEETYLIDGEFVELPSDIEDDNGFARCGHGGLIIKASEIEDFVRDLCERYDTYGVERTFKAADGREVTIPANKSTYGNKIDEEAEIEWLKEAVRSGRPQKHEPALLHSALYLAEDDIGGRYIEVDKAKQTLYYFVDGKIDMEIPVVTGCSSLGRNTPSGVYDIYFMQKNRTLRGEGYTSFVKFWMAFTGHYGIHDASWRRDFGGEIYVHSGSHGCVNIPTADAEILYQKVEVGVPVIVHD